MPLPSALAAYSARSALRNSTSSVPPAPPGLVATPMLARTGTGAPDSRNGSASTPISRSARATAASSVAPSDSSTANSSPPSRTGRSPGRTAPAIRCAAATSSSSPTLCPWVSLTSLKLSRSMSSIAATPPQSWARARARSARSWNRSRLPRPVSESR